MFNFNFNEDLLDQMSNAVLAQVANIITDESIDYVDRYNLVVSIIEMFQDFQEQLNDETSSNTSETEYFMKKNGM
jgi:hypothetical protein